MAANAVKLELKLVDFPAFKRFLQDVAEAAKYATPSTRAKLLKAAERLAEDTAKL
jgi:hypothetical protein